MKWFMNKGKDNDIVVSTRVRFARNLDAYPFPVKLDSTKGLQVINDVKNALDNRFTDRLNYIDLSKKKDTELMCLAEDHIISSEFVSYKPFPKMLITNEESNLSIMVNEEDHLRIQAIYPGFALEDAYLLASRADDCIEKDIKYAYDENLGYLTSCPTNLGTGLRASVMVHIPAICKSGYLKGMTEFLTKVGLTIRGLYGEGSEGDGCFFQISNQITLGISEKDTLEKLKVAVDKIISLERQQRECFKSDNNIDLQDKICRSVGVLKTARRLSATEALKLISDARLCSDIGLIKGFENLNFLKLMSDIMPSHIIMQNKEAENDARLRDYLRAEYIRKQLEDIKI